VSDEQFNIRFNEQGASDVIKRMREVVSSAGDAAEATENLNDQLGKVQAKANPAQAAYEKLASGIDVLGRAQKAGLITMDQEARSRTNLIGRMEAQVRPFSTLVSNIQNETRALSLNRTERDATLRTMQQMQSLQSRGVALSAQEREQLAATNLAYVRQRESIAATAAAERERVVAAQTAAREVAAAARQEEQAKIAAARQAAAEKARIHRESQTQQAQGARRDSIVGSVVPKIEAETAAYRLNTVERNANLRTIQQSEALRTSGITLTEEETAAILSANVALAQQREANQLLASTERELNSVRSRTSTNPAQAAQSRLNADRATVGRAGAVGLISGSEQAALERQLGLAYEAQINPLIRTNELLQQRASYQSGLFESGRALALVERDVAAAEEAGIAVSREQIASLRAQAQQIDRVEGAYRSLKTASGLLGNVIGGFALAGGAGELGKSIDETTNVRNLVGVTSTGPQNQQDATQGVYKVAEDTRSSVEDTAKLYSRLELAAQRFGIGQTQVLGLTKEVNEQIRLSGTSEGEATRAVIDFAHSIGSGNVQFRELRALTQQAPFVAVEIAKGLTALAKEGTAQGEAFKQRASKAGINVDQRDIGIGDLKELTSKKALGSNDIIAAQALEADDTQKRFEKLTPTIAQAGVQLKDFFLQYVDSANQSTGAGRNIAEGIEFIGKNLSTIIPIVLIAGSALAGLFIAEKLIQGATLIGVLFEKVGIGIGVTKTATGATAGNTTAMDKNTIAQGVNAKEVDAVTAALARQTIARREASGAAAPKPGVGAAGAGAAAEEVGVGVAAVEGEGAAVAGSAALGIGAVATGFTVVIPLILAAAAAYALLKDNVNLATDQTIAYSDDGVTKAIQGNITLGDVAGAIFSNIQTGATETAGVQKKASDDTAATDKKNLDDRLNHAKANFDKTHTYYNQMASGIVKTSIDVATFLETTQDRILLGFDLLAGGIEVAFANAFDYVANKFGDLLNATVIPGLNLIAKADGAKGVGNVPKVNLTGAADADNAQRKLRDQKKLDDDQKNYAEGLAKAVTDRFVKRNTPAVSTLSNSAGNGDDGLPPDKAKKEKKDPLIAEFDELLKKTFPAVEAIRSLNKELDVLAKASVADKEGVVLLAQAAKQISDYDKQYGVNIAGTKDGAITAGQLKGQITDRLKDQTLDAIDPDRSFQRDQTAKQQSFNFDANSTATNPFQRTIDNKVFEQEQKEAQQRKVNISVIQEEEGAKIRLAVTNTSLAEQAAKVREAIVTESADRTRQISQLGQSTAFIKAQDDAYKVYGVSILAGVAGSKEAYDALVAQNVAFEQLKTRVDSAKASYETIIGPAKEFNSGVQALNDLMSQGLITIDQYDKKVRDLNSSFLATKTDAGSGIQRAFLDISKEADDSAADMERTFKDAYNNIESGFSSLFTGGDPKAALHKVLEGVTNDLSKTLFHNITDGPVKNIANSLGIKGFGDKAIQTQRTDITATNVYVNGQQTGQLGNGGAGGGLLGGSTPGANPLGLGSTGVNPLTGAANDNSVASILSGGGGQGGAAGLLGGSNPLAGLGLPTDPLASILSPSPSSALSSLLNPGSASSLLGGGGGLGGLPSLLGGGGAAAGGGGGLLGGLSGILGGGGAAGGGGLLGGLSSLIGGGASAAGGGITSLISSILPFFGFATGGSFNVGGAGGTDSQVVSFKATPGENVSVGTPTQLQAAHDAAANAGQAAPQVNQKIVNVMDPQAALDAMGTQAGFKVVLNHIASNPEAIKRALGG
jgi:hypothetical protein